jgi:hypothetical protein
MAVPYSPGADVQRPSGRSPSWQKHSARAKMADIDNLGILSLYTGGPSRPQWFSLACI